MRRLGNELHQMGCFVKGPTQVKVSQVFKEKNTRKWLWLGLAVFVALQIYFVQELLAALMLYLVDRAGQWGLGWAGAHARPAAQMARRGLTAVEDLSKKPFHRPRSE